MIATVHDLEVGLVPREEFARRQWFSADDLKTTTAGVPIWYYHRPGRPVARRASPDMYEKIDPSLRHLCLDLHRADLPTFPSCEGHFHPRQYFRAVWDELERHCASIRGTGLPLTDSESGEQLVFQNPRYELPWPSFEHFHDKLGATQPGGYLGIALLPRTRDLSIARELSRSPLSEARAHSCIQHPWPGSIIAAVYVDPTSPDDVQHQWSSVRRYFRQLLRHPHLGRSAIPVQK